MTSFEGIHPRGCDGQLPANGETTTGSGSAGPPLELSADRGRDRRAPRDDQSVRLRASGKSGQSVPRLHVMRREVRRGDGARDGAKCGRRAAAYHTTITEKRDAGLSVQRIWQDLVEEFGYSASYELLKRYVRALAPTRRAVGVFHHAPGASESRDLEHATGALHGWLRGAHDDLRCSILCGAGGVTFQLEQDSGDQTRPTSELALLDLLWLRRARLWRRRASPVAFAQRFLGAAASSLSWNRCLCTRPP